jgi:hypothetical protein
LHSIAIAVRARSGIPIPNRMSISILRRLIESFQVANPLFGSLLMSFAWPLCPKIRSLESNVKGYDIMRRSVISFFILATALSLPATAAAPQGWYRQVSVKYLYAGRVGGGGRL